MNASKRCDFPLLDVLRLLASVIIVHFHMRGESLFGVGFGLPLFLVIMFALAARSTKLESIRAFAQRKASYLLTPWLRWSAFYWVVLGLADAARGGGIFDRIEPGMLFYGGHLSLWFLPFAALALIPVKALQRVSRKLSPRSAAISFGIAAAIATSVTAWLLPKPKPDIPVRLWIRFTPTLLWGVAVAHSVRASDADERARLLASTAGLALLSAFLSPFRDYAEQVPLGFAIAVCLACVGFGFRPRVPTALRSLSTVTFGIYLLRPFIGKLLGSAFDVFVWPPLVHTALTWSLSCIGVLALRRASFDWQELGVALRPVQKPARELLVHVPSDSTRRAA